jgi:hypothetical protein
MAVAPTPHGDYHYELVHTSRAGTERVHPFATDEPLEPGSVLRYEGRYWLIAELDGSRALAKPGRYRLELRHPDGRVEAGAYRRFRPDAPTIGHTFTTMEDGHPVSWEVRDSELGRDEQGEPYLRLVAERDFAELEEMPDHELEHTLSRREADELPEGAEAALARAQAEGLSVELAALDPGEEPDWDEAQRFIDALILEQLEDDLIEQAGVDPDADPQETWLPRVKERLSEDLRRFREDIEGEHDHLEEWRFRGARIVASIGREEEESDPDSGHGWMCRLLDSGALGVAGFQRVQKARLELLET